jgi:dipicolinate synthase subunit A
VIDASKRSRGWRRAHGFHWAERGIPGVTHLDDPAAVLKGARVALFPIPGIAANGALFAPAAAKPIIPTRDMLAGMTAHAHITNLKSHAEKRKGVLRA